MKILHWIFLNFKYNTKFGFWGATKCTAVKEVMDLQQGYTTA